jgi:HEAT repeat protein
MSIPKQNGINWEQLQQLCANYPERTFAKYIVSSTVERINNTFFLDQNPIISVSLLSINFGDDTEFSRFSPKDYFEHLINNLWGLGGSKNIDEYLSVEDGIAKIAAIFTENGKTFIAYEEALNYILSESLLHHCIDVGLFVLKAGKLRFSLKVIKDYFAALALVKYGVPSRLPTLSLNSQSARIPQKWDVALKLASRFALSEKLIRRVADSDPLLALECLTSNEQRDPQLYSYVVEKCLESLVGIGDFRTDFATLLYKFDASMAQAILLEVLRNGKWEVRQYAYQKLSELNIPLKVGLVESLTNLNEESRTKVIQVLKRIAADALPTLFQMLHHDDDTTRCNAIWALGEIADKASVPALVTLLENSNLHIAILAAKALARTQDVYALPFLIKELQHRHTNLRNSVTGAIMSLFDQQRDQFIKISQQLDITIRREMVIYLSSSKFNNLKIDLFLELTRDEDVDIRIAAIQALAPIREGRVIARFKECQDDMSKSRLNKSSVGEIVSRILQNVPHGESASNFRDKSQEMNSSQIVKSRLLNAKVRSSSQDNIDVATGNETYLESDTDLEDGYVTDILTQLRSRKWDTSNNAAKMLRDYMKSLRGNASSKVINQVLETLNDDDWVIRWTGVESLGWVGNIHVVPHLIQRLSDSNWKIRVAAIRALAEIKDNSAIAGLSKLSTDTNTVVREAAAEALGFLDGKQAVVALEVFAADSEDFVRLAGVESLGRVGEKAATTALLTGLKDPSEHVRWASANGLFGIANPTMVPQLIPSLSDIGGPYWEQKRICDVIIDILKKINTEEAKKAIAEWQTKQA